MGSSTVIFAFLLCGTIAFGRYPELNSAVHQDQNAPLPEGSSKFYAYFDITDTYKRRQVMSFEQGANLSALCPQKFKFTKINPPVTTGPETDRTVEYRIPHNSIFADAEPCISSSGPFTAVYSFLERPAFIPSNFAQSAWSDSVGKWLISKFMEKGVVESGGRAFFGFDANSRTCGDFSFPGVAGNKSTLSMFFAAKQQLNHPVLGSMAANDKHYVIVVRNLTHPLFQCSYSAPPPNTSPSPTPTPTRTPSPSATPSITVSPTPSLSVGASPSTTSSTSTAPSASPTASLSVGASPSTSASTSAGAVPDGGFNGGTAGSATNAQAGSCFPADATVELVNGRRVSMDKLRIGDKVRAGPDTFSEVFMFTHRLDTGVYDYLRFLLADGRSVQMSPGHYAYINGHKVAARDVHVGDSMDSSQVVEIQVSKNGGLYNPQTAHGDIVVDGIRASTYTEEITPLVAHPLLTAVRFLHRVTGFQVELFENGWDGVLAPFATA